MKRKVSGGFGPIEPGETREENSTRPYTIVMWLDASDSPVAESPESVVGYLSSRAVHLEGSTIRADFAFASPQDADAIEGVVGCILKGIERPTAWGERSIEVGGCVELRGERATCPLVCKATEGSSDSRAAPSITPLSTPSSP